MREVSRSNEFWTGATADAARDNARGIAAAGDDAARHLVIASVAARDGADQIAAAQTSLLTRVAEARDGGFDVADDGAVSIRAGPPPLLVALSGGDAVRRARHAHDAGRQAELTRSTDALDRLAAADSRRSRRHRGGVRVVAGPAGRPDGSRRSVAGSGIRRGGGMAGDEPGPHRRADRRHDTCAASATDRGIPPAGRQHRRRALGYAGRRQPRQHRAGDRRRPRRSGKPAADRLLPHPAQ